MKKKLLNFSKNLIIVLGLVVMIEMLFFATRSYAATDATVNEIQNTTSSTAEKSETTDAGEEDSESSGGQTKTVGQTIRAKISSWYKFISRASLAFFASGYLIMILKLLADKTPEKLKIVKESVFKFLIMFAIIAFLHYIMIAVMMLNEQGVGVAKSLGARLSGIDGQTDEYDLYETALSKAYEISAVPGFIGLVMYFLLVFYTYKFVFVYAKRFINIIVLMLIAPILFAVSTMKQIITGINDNSVKKWLKEFIFNVVIQTLHALFYATLIGFVLKLSDNDENLIGSLIVLIIFGFIFKIDGIIRKIFNFVGGSTTISSRATSKVLNTASSLGGAIGSGAAKFGGAVGSGAIKFGQNVKAFNEKADDIGFKEAIKEDASAAFNNAKTKFKELPKETFDGAKNLYGKTKEGVKNLAKEGYEIGKDVLTGEEVKKNLTTDEVIDQYHKMENAKGLEKLRQGVQSVGFSVVGKVKNLSKIGKYTKKGLKTVYEKSDKFVKRKIVEIQNELVAMKSDLNNDIETVKKVPKLVKKLKKNRRYVKNADGLEMDMSSTMMLVVDSNDDPEKIVKELTEACGKGVNIRAFTFQKLGAQTFLSPAVGSSRLGLSVLAEDRYESLAERRIDRALGKAFPRVRLKRASRVLKNSQYTNKVYKFSRFNPDTARKITRRMLKETREQNRYLIVLNRAYESLDTLKPVGTIKSEKIEVSQKLRLTRRRTIKTTRKIKLEQESAIKSYRATARNANRVCLANNVASRAISAKNAIKARFRKIDKLTPGQMGLRRRIHFGNAYQVSKDAVMTKKSNAETKIKATGIVSAKDKDTVVQFVVTKEGSLAPQIVSTSGKVLKPAVEKNGEIIAHESKMDEAVRLSTKPVTEEQVDTKPITSNEPVMKPTFTEEYDLQDAKFSQYVVSLDGQIVEQVLDSNNEILTERYVIVDKGVSDVLAQINNVVTNEDLGLPEDTELDERMSYLESSVQEMTSEIPESRVDQVIDKAIETEYVRSVEEMLGKGEFTKTGETITLDQKTEKFSELLMNLARQKVDQIAGVPGTILSQTLEEAKAVIEEEKSSRLTPEEIEQLEAQKAYEKMLEEAEEKWAEANGVEADDDIVKHSEHEGEEYQEGIGKVTLQFFGAIKKQGQSVSLSTKHSLKDFYDKVDKLESADLEKTQERFLQMYGKRLEAMQLSSYTFAKPPVSAMDNWSIYVVSIEEDITEGEKELESEVIPKEVEEEIDDDVLALYDKYYVDLKRTFVKFIDETEIESFDDLHNNRENLRELSSKFRTLLFMRGESESREKAIKMADNIHKDVRFKNILKQTVKDRLAKKLLEERQKKVKEKFEIKSKEKAEKEAEKDMTKEEVESTKRADKDSIAEEVFTELRDEEEQEAAVSPDLQQLLDQLDEDKVYIQVDRSGKGNKKDLLRYEY